MARGSSAPAPTPFQRLSVWTDVPLLISAGLPLLRPIFRLFDHLRSMRSQRMSQKWAATAVYFGVA